MDPYRAPPPEPSPPRGPFPWRRALRYAVAVSIPLVVIAGMIEGRSWYRAACRESPDGAALVASLCAAAAGVVIASGGSRRTRG